MILINGCSFTSGMSLNNPLCVYSVDYCNQNSLPFVNIAVPGNSNENIRSTTISELLTGDYKFVMINWTTPWRLTLGKLIPGQTPMNIFPTHAFNGNIDDNSKYIDRQFTKHGLISELAFAQRNHLIERVVYIGAQRRREHARMS